MSTQSAEAETQSAAAWPTDASATCASATCPAAGTTTASAASASTSTSTSTSTAATSTTSSARAVGEQWAGCGNDQHRYRSYCEKLRYPHEMSPSSCDVASPQVPRRNLPQSMPHDLVEFGHNPVPHKKDGRLLPADITMDPPLITMRCLLAVC